MNAATAFLNILVGGWELTGQMGQTPLQQAVEGRWTLGGLFVELYFRSRLPAEDGRPPYAAVYHIGYNAEHDRYVLHLLDTFGVGLTYIPGIGAREGDTIPFIFHYADGPFTNRLSWDAATQTWTFEQHYIEQGQVHAFATKRMIRVSPEGA